MFSMFKKSDNMEEVVLSELSEGQLTQVAGGGCSYHQDDCDTPPPPKHHHHHHHHKAAPASSSQGNNWNCWHKPAKW